MNLAADETSSFTPGRDHRYDPIIYMLGRRYTTRKTGSRKYSKILAARGLGIAARTSCFPFEPAEESAFYFVTPYNQARKQTPVGASWGNCDHRTSRRLHFTSLSLPSSSGPAIHSTGKFPFQFTGTSSPDDAPQQRRHAGSFCAAEMDT